MAGRENDAHDLLFVCAPANGYEGEGFCLCGWRCRSPKSISAVYRQLEAHIAAQSGAARALASR